MSVAEELSCLKQVVIAVDWKWYVYPLSKPWGPAYYDNTIMCVTKAKPDI